MVRRKIKLYGGTVVLLLAHELIAPPVGWPRPIKKPWCRPDLKRHPFVPGAVRARRL
jgi:hypothetical protein